MTPSELFQQLHGIAACPTLPTIHSQSYQTAKGTAYLQSPGIAMLSRPYVNINGLAGFLGGFDPSLGFADYLVDPAISPPSGAQLCKIAGQTCYMSFGPKRTKNDQSVRYFDNIKSSGHGSVLEHANYSFLLYGISRSVTHELVRHRHLSFSQVSQRYVSGKVLRFVERPEYLQERILHAAFEQRIDAIAQEYADLTNYLLLAQKSGETILSADEKTDLRKKVQQCARSALTNETEAPIVVTGNARAWRHFIEMRASSHAEIEIRELAVRIFLCLHQVDSVLFGDYELEQLNDGTYGVKTEYRKV